MVIDPPSLAPQPRSRRALILAAPLLLVGHHVVTSAQDQPAAPTVGATPAATPAVVDGCPADGACPVGCWVVSDIAGFIESGLMDVTGVEDLRFVAAEGTLAFTFAPDGGVRISADRYRVAVKAEIRVVGEVDTAVAFDGELVGRYTFVGEVLTIDGLVRQDLVITVETPVGDVGIDNDDVFAGGTSRLVCDAATDTLRLYPDATRDAAIVLSRTSAMTASGDMGRAKR